MNEQFLNDWDAAIGGINGELVNELVTPGLRVTVTRWKHDNTYSVHVSDSILTFPVGVGLDLNAALELFGRYDQKDSSYWL